MRSSSLLSRSHQTRRWQLHLCMWENGRSPHASVAVAVGMHPGGHRCHQAAACCRPGPGLQPTSDSLDWHWCHCCLPLTPIFASPVASKSEDGKPSRIARTMRNFSWTGTVQETAGAMLSCRTSSMKPGFVSQSNAVVDQAWVKAKLTGLLARHCNAQHHAASKERSRS